jgi:hypothetical protein
LELLAYGIAKGASLAAVKHLDAPGDRRLASLTGFEATLPPMKLRFFDEVELRRRAA